MAPSEIEHEIVDDQITRPLGRCPACGSDRLDPVVEKERQTVHHLCRDCSRCWHVELGFVQRMAPAVCFGCPERERCVAAFEADQEQTRT